MGEEWTPEDEATFRPLKQKYDRIHAKSNRDKTRKRTFKRRLKGKDELERLKSEVDLNFKPVSNIDFKTGVEKKEDKS